MNKITHINQVPPDKGYYIAGFVDGEGSFYISARKRDDYPSGWRFTLHFNISNQDLAVLEICIFRRLALDLWTFSLMIPFAGFITPKIKAK